MIVSFSEMHGFYYQFQAFCLLICVIAFLWGGPISVDLFYVNSKIEGNCHQILFFQQKPHSNIKNN
jgi:hypothetical protein